MQMQVIKQNYDENQVMRSDMQEKTKADAQNGANASDMQRKKMWARKAMQMQAKTDVGTQNDANASENGCWHAK